MGKKSPSGGLVSSVKYSVSATTASWPGHCPTCGLRWSRPHLYSLHHRPPVLGFCSFGFSHKALSVPKFLETYLFQDSCLFFTPHTHCATHTKHRRHTFPTPTKPDAVERRWASSGIEKENVREKSELTADRGLQWCEQKWSFKLGAPCAEMWVEASTEAPTEPPTKAPTELCGLGTTTGNSAAEDSFTSKKGIQTREMQRGCCFECWRTRSIKHKNEKYYIKKAHREEQLCDNSWNCLGHVDWPSLNAKTEPAPDTAGSRRGLQPAGSRG